MALEIKPITGSTKEKHDIPNILPQPPFRLILVAPSSSGKTTLINNILTRSEFGYNKLFKKNVFLFSPSIKYDDALDKLGVKDDNTRSHYDEKFINEIVEDQKEVINKHGKNKAPHILMLFDDIVLELPKTKSSELKKLFFYGRKFKISLIITTQKYRQLEPAYRLNASQYVYFQNINTKEYDAIADDQPISKTVFKNIWKHAQDQGEYSFVYVDLTEKLKDRYYINFTSRVRIK